MPTYSFSCGSCEKSFDSFLTMSKCEEPLGEACPECGESGKVVKAYTAAPTAWMDSNYMVDKPQGGQFQDRMQHIMDNHQALDKEARDNLGRHTTR